MSIISKSQARRIVATDPEVEQLRQEKEDIRQELLEARREISALKQVAEGHPDWHAQWLQSKVERQRKMLDRLTLTVTGQRLVLRAINNLGRGLTREEYVRERATWNQDTRLSERLEDYFPYLEK